MPFTYPVGLLHILRSLPAARVNVFETPRSIIY
jgi:hypothetical protein